MAAIEILGLEKIYRKGFWRTQRQTALRPLHLRVESGEVFGFLGPNGAGKTTTLKLLLDLVVPTSGTAKILGMDYQDARVKARIGFLPEQPNFPSHLTASELLRYLARLSGVPSRDVHSLANAALRSVDMSSASNMALRKFSKGMLQRVGIAQAILHDPELVFLDEPMSGLDPMGRRDVRDLILRLKSEGRTVFFSTHILPDAEALSDRVAVLNHGELRAVGSLAELTAGGDHRIELVWRGEELSQQDSLLRTAGISASDYHVSGGAARAVIDTAQMHRGIQAIAAGGMRLVSVIPVRSSLEDYFVSEVGRVIAPQLNARARTQAAGAAV